MLMRAQRSDGPWLWGSGPARLWPGFRATTWSRSCRPRWRAIAHNELLHYSAAAAFSVRYRTQCRAMSCQLENTKGWRTWPALRNSAPSLHLLGCANFVGLHSDVGFSLRLVDRGAHERHGRVRRLLFHDRAFLRRGVLNHEKLVRSQGGRDKRSESYGTKRKFHIHDPFLAGWSGTAWRYLLAGRLPYNASLLDSFRGCPPKTTVDWELQGSLVNSSKYACD